MMASQALHGSEVPYPAHTLSGVSRGSWAWQIFCRMRLPRLTRGGMGEALWWQALYRRHEHSGILRPLCSPRAALVPPMAPSLSKPGWVGYSEADSPTDTLRPGTPKLC